LRPTRQTRHCGEPHRCVSEERECSCKCQSCLDSGTMRRTLLNRAMKEIHNQEHHFRERCPKCNREDEEKSERRKAKRNRRAAKAQKG